MRISLRLETRKCPGKRIRLCLQMPDQEPSSASHFGQQKCTRKASRWMGSGYRFKKRVKPWFFRFLKEGRSIMSSSVIPRADGRRPRIAISDVDWNIVTLMISGRRQETSLTNAHQPERPPFRHRKRPSSGSGSRGNGSPLPFQLVPGFGQDSREHPY